MWPWFGYFSSDREQEGNPKIITRDASDVDTFFKLKEPLVECTQQKSVDGAKSPLPKTETHDFDWWDRENERPSAAKGSRSSGKSLIPWAILWLLFHDTNIRANSKQNFTAGDESCVAMYSRMEKYINISLEPTAAVVLNSNGKQAASKQEQRVKQICSTFQN